MKGFVLGVVVTILAIVGILYTYFAMGMAPVATSESPMPFEKKLARMALHARLGKEMPSQVPVQADEAKPACGRSCVRVEQCAVCHGLPGQEQSAIAKGEFPHPPHLFKGKGVTDDEPGETYWKVANGIPAHQHAGLRQESFHHRDVASLSAAGKRRQIVGCHQGGAGRAEKIRHVSKIGLGLRTSGFGPRTSDLGPLSLSFTRRSRFFACEEAESRRTPTNRTGLQESIEREFAE